MLTAISSGIIGTVAPHAIYLHGFLNISSYAKTAVLPITESGEQQKALYPSPIFAEISIPGGAFLLKYSTMFWAIFGGS